MAPIILAKDPGRLSRLRLAVFDGFCPDVAEIEQLYEQLAPVLVDGPTHGVFIRIEDLRLDPDECARELGVLYGDAATLIIRHVRRLLDVVSLADIEARYVVLWCLTHRTTRREYYCHFDADVLTKDCDSNAKHPSLGSILYLAPDAVLNGGDTVFCLEDVS